MLQLTENGTKIERREWYTLACIVTKNNDQFLVKYGSGFGQCQNTTAYQLIKHPLSE